uniref:HTH psq-type domain-containing protein n=1 Tax=Graphocephala atropunctata TaxID=36148 RepID=A0A1B6LHI7_9HEMI
MAGSDSTGRRGVRSVIPDCTSIVVAGWVWPMFTQTDTGNFPHQLTTPFPYVLGPVDSSRVLALKVIGGVLKFIFHLLKMADKKRKQLTVSMEMKFDALKRLDKGEHVNKIALDLNVGRSTVLGWKNKKSEIELWWIN